MSGLPVSQETQQVYAGGTSQQVTVSTSSAQSSVLNCKSVVIFSTVSGFMRQGSNPTALSNGTDQYVPGNTLLRYAGITPGNKLAFIGTGAGTLYITPDL